MSGSLLLVASLEDSTGIVHILVFDGLAEVGSWDVAQCGNSLGDYAPVRFDAPEGLPLDSLCQTCFKSIGNHWLALSGMSPV